MLIGRAGLNIFLEIRQRPVKDRLLPGRVLLFLICPASLQGMERAQAKALIQPLPENFVVMPLKHIHCFLPDFAVFAHKIPLGIQRALSLMLFHVVLFPGLELRIRADQRFLHQGVLVADVIMGNDSHEVAARAGNCFQQIVRPIMPGRRADNIRAAHLPRLGHNSFIIQALAFHGATSI